MINLQAKLFKVLSRNDTGETHSHQSGISIPKTVANSGIFPLLGTDTLNPRTDIFFIDETGKEWLFQYIYYNDAFFGKNSNQAHNEYRLTCVKNYIQDNNIHSGDSIWFGIDEHKERYIGFVRKENDNIVEQDGKTIIKLSSNWRFIKY